MPAISFKKKLSALAITILATSILAGCMPKPQPRLTAEQQKQAQEMQALMIAQMKKKLGMQPQLQQPAIQQQAPSQPANQPTISEETLAAKARELKLSEELVAFEDRKDGVVINGRPIVDMEGEIIDSGYNDLTGQFTYVVRTGTTSFAIRYGTSNSLDRITIAKGHFERGTYRVNTVTGKTLSGKGVIPIADGFIVARDQAAFKYRIGSGVQSLATPESYHVAALQQGDIASTGYILLEKDKVKDNGDNPLTSLMNIANKAMDIVDRKIKDDYMLVHIGSGKQTLVDVSLDSKTTAFLSNCRKKSTLINICDTARYKESLYDQNGLKNLGHYYWSIRWFNTESGPFMVARERGFKEISVTHLGTGQRLVAFQRTMGISHFDVSRNPDGSIALEANLGFSSERIEKH